MTFFKHYYSTESNSLLKNENYYLIEIIDRLDEVTVLDHLTTVWKNQNCWQNKILIFLSGEGCHLLFHGDLLTSTSWAAHVCKHLWPGEEKGLDMSRHLFHYWSLKPVSFIDIIPYLSKMSDSIFKNSKLTKIFSHSKQNVTVLQYHLIQCRDIFISTMWSLELYMRSV